MKRSNQTSNSLEKSLIDTNCVDVNYLIYKRTSKNILDFKYKKISYLRSNSFEMKPIKMLTVMAISKDKMNSTKYINADLSKSIILNDKSSRSSLTICNKAINSVIKGQGRREKQEYYTEEQDLDKVRESDNRNRENTGIFSIKSFIKEKGLSPLISSDKIIIFNSNNLNKKYKNERKKSEYSSSCNPVSIRKPIHISKFSLLNNLKNKSYSENKILKVFESSSYLNYHTTINTNKC